MNAVRRRWHRPGDSVRWHVVDAIALCIPRRRGSGNLHGGFGGRRGRDLRGGGAGERTRGGRPAGCNRSAPRTLPKNIDTRAGQYHQDHEHKRSERRIGLQALLKIA